MSETLVRYYTQRRTHKNEHASDWEEVCQGHPDQYNAIKCHDELRAAMVNEPTGENEATLLEINRQIHRGFVEFKRDGYEIEMRVVKITQTIEVVEEPCFVALGRIKPKKELK